MKEATEKREQLIFTYKPTISNPDYYLLGLLKEMKAERGIIPKQWVLEATRAFWSPLACFKAQQYSEDCVTQMFWESLGKLDAQKGILWNTVGKPLNLERPQINSETPEVSSNNKKSNSSEKKLELSAKMSKIYSGFEYDGTGIL